MRLSRNAAGMKAPFFFLPRLCTAGVVGIATLLLSSLAQARDCHWDDMPPGSARGQRRAGIDSGRCGGAVGPVGLEIRSGDVATLQQLIAWKSAQCRRTKWPD